MFSIVIYIYYLLKQRIESDDIIRAPISFEREDRRKNYKKLNDSFGGSEIELLSWVGMTDHARAQMSLDALQYSPILGLSKIIFLFVEI